MNTPLVSISCITYNHAHYIKDALEGFLMQQTNFPFEVLIHDDCSTDGTDKIIREYAERYPDIIKPMYETVNQYSQGKPIGSMIWNIPRAKGKYIAICEGDDYWSDALKLQKQVDFLEANPSYGLCFTDFNIKNETNSRFTKSVFKNKIHGFSPFIESPERFIFAQPYLCPPSWIMRKEIFPTELLGSCDCSFVYFTHYLTNSKVKYLDFTSSTYRITEESATHSSNFNKMYNRMQNILQTKLKLIDYYSLNSDYKQLCIENHYRLNLVDLIIHHKNDDVKRAEKILKNKSIRERILFGTFHLHLSPLLKIARRIKPTNI